MSSIFAKKTIRARKSLGSILLSQRKKKKIVLIKAEMDTKIRLKYLKALENDDYENMPPDVYMKGFLKRYCDYLKMNYDKCYQRYDQEKQVYEQLKSKKFSFYKKKDQVLKPGNASKYQEKLKFIITPQLFVSALVVFIVVGILGYIWFQVKSFAAAPDLELNNPNEQIIVSTDDISITGSTDNNALLYINGQEVGIDEEGNFIQMVELDNGINEIQIKAVNKANKETIKNIKILVINEEGLEGGKDD